MILLAHFIWLAAGGMALFGALLCLSAVIENLKPSGQAIWGGCCKNVVVNYY